MNTNLYFQRAMVLIESGSAALAIEQLNRSLEEFPQHVESFYQRGLLYFKQKNYKESINDFNNAMLLDPLNPFRYSSRAYVLSHIGDYQQAIEDYKKAIELDPEDAISLNNLGLLLEKAGYRKESEEYFTKADAIADRGKVFEKPSLDQLLSKQKEFEQNQAEFKKLDALAKNTSNKQTYFSIIREVFTSPATFQEFLAFIRLRKKKNL